ncbi:MlaD family protein [Neptunomonas sp. XY-337]|uniref:PqiB family protein n=1 Tax=Neptunomonas sp. XY-337 TaxID=2561897 RepID=UPI0010AA5752|nr:MlaD family protein [Neptunomonas sp. XY-337]
MSDNDPIIRRRRMPSAVWLLPLIAAIIAGWLVYKNYTDRGIKIEVLFDSAAGLEANKTKVLYRGLPAGVVKKLEIDENLRQVRAFIEMAPQADDSLTDKAKFWLVKPQVSLSGVRGLETLLSGHYIGFQPGLGGNSTREFTALNQQPPPIKDAEGLYLTLTADSARSVYQGANVFYRDISVGEVLSHSLSKDGKEVLIEVYIEPRYTHLIRENTRFWNAGGIKVKADLPKIDIEVGSLASLIAGGIHFSTPQTDSPAAQSGALFTLFGDFEDAQDGIEITLRFPGATELTEGAKVQSRGVQVGRVTRVALTDDFKHLDATLLIDPRAEDMLRSGSRFWLQKPDLSLDNLKLSALLRGSYIELDAGQGERQRQFTALTIPPAKRQLSMGASIELHTKQLGSITQGSPLLYRQLPVGEVISYELATAGDYVVIHAVIEQRYAHLLSGNSRFWNASGIRLSANIDEIKLRTESTSALLQGGIAFFNPTQKRTPVSKDKIYSLFEDYQAATENGRLADANRAQTLRFRLHTESVGSLTSGAPILYKQVPVGQVLETVLDKNGRSLTIFAEVEAKYRHLVHEGSRFWDVSGINAQVSLKEARIRTESLKSLLRGGIAFENPQQGAKVKANHLFTLYPDHESSVQQPLAIRVTFPTGKNLQPLADIRYQGQNVGKVRTVRVVNEGKAIEADIDLYRDGHFLAREGSDFWIVEPVIRLSSIENPEGVILGNYVEARKGDGAAKVQFTGLRETPPFQDRNGLNIIVRAAQLGSLVKGSPVFYRQVPVGSVVGYDLHPTEPWVEIFLNVAPEYANFVKKQSEFANISGLRVDFSLLGGLDIQTESLETLVGGGLSFTSPTNGTPAQSGDTFTVTSNR